MLNSRTPPHRHRGSLRPHLKKFPFKFLKGCPKGGVVYIENNTLSPSQVGNAVLPTHKPPQKHRIANPTGKSSVPNTPQAPYLG